jgi:uncharacterized membrane protein
MADANPRKRRLRRESQDVVSTRTLILILAVALVVACIPIVVYAFQFAKSGRLSSSTTIWGAFGGYVGGILGPLFAIAAFVVLVANFRIQQLQWRYLQRKEKRDEWRNAIIDADRLLREQLKTKVVAKQGVTDLQRLLFAVGSEAFKAQESDREFVNALFSKYSSDITVDSYTGTGTLVCDIWLLLEGFSGNLIEQDGNLLSFYISYFQDVTTRLYNIGVISESHWKNELGPRLAKLMQRAAGFIELR